MGKGGQCVGLTTLPPLCAVVMKSGNLKFLEPSGPLKACNGTDFVCRLGEDVEKGKCVGWEMRKGNGVHQEIREGFKRRNVCISFGAEFLCVRLLTGITNSKRYIIRIL